MFETLGLLVLLNTSHDYFFHFFFFKYAHYITLSLLVYVKTM